jgi:hypothetical protein
MSWSCYWQPVLPPTPHLHHHTHHGDRPHPPRPGAAADAALCHNRAHGDRDGEGTGRWGQQERHGGEDEEEEEGQQLGAGHWMRALACVCAPVCVHVCACVCVVCWWFGLEGEIVRACV